MQIAVWPDGTWVEEDEVEIALRDGKSDDFYTVEVESEEAAEQEATAIHL